MKHTLFILLVLWLAGTAPGQKQDLSLSLDIDMTLIPAGTIELNGLEIHVNAFRMSEEITNREYREFIEALKANPDDSMGVIDPDKITPELDIRKSMTFYQYGEILEKVTYSNGWGGEQDFENYFYDEKYDDFPVAGVTYESAKFFCLWKTQQINILRREKGLPQAAEFRLPTETEWMYAAKKADTDTEHVSQLRKVKSGEQNRLGLHNLNNNVSEWTGSQSEEGLRIAKGSSWKQQTDISHRMKRPEGFRDNATGFRVVMSVTEP